MTTTAMVGIAQPAPPGPDDPGGRGEDFGKSSPLGLLVLLAFLIAVVFLARSMSKHLKRVPATFDPPADEPPATDEPPTNEAPAGDAKTGEAKTGDARFSGATTGGAETGGAETGEAEATGSAAAKAEEKPEARNGAE